jgi:hypothetical protein
MSMRPLVGLLALIILFSDGSALSRPAEGLRVEIVLEKNESGSWKSVDPRSVLDQNDRVRFRVKTNFTGYLYVSTLNTSGKYEVLFPIASTGRQNKLEAERSYVIPAADAAFRIAGPPGQEIVYWLVSPAEITGVDTAPPNRPSTPKPPSTLVPRCDGALLRARGDCIDLSAGLKPVDPNDQLPGALAKRSDLRSRDLIFEREEEKAIVSAAGRLGEPVVYEFRLAHK